MTDEDVSRAFQVRQTLWARLLLESLYDAGVDRFVVSPGSRSTPLVSALQALSLPFDLVIDERSAAFLALGRAKLRGAPVALVCTSGSAAAHYFPAVIEASESHTPLLVLSADRPPELLGNRSAQTTDQRRLYGQHVRHFDELGLPDGSEGALRGLRRRAAQAVALTHYPVPGPVHLNVAARKPLEPASDSELGSERAAYDRVRATPLTRHHPPRSTPSAAGLADLAPLFAAAQRPALAIGPSAPSRGVVPEVAARFAEETGWPLVVEATSNLRFGLPRLGDGAVLVWDAFDLCLRATKSSDAFVPDAVLQVGDVPTSTPWLDALEGVPRAIVAEHAFPDPPNGAAHLLRAEPAVALAALAPVLPKATAHWQRTIARANALAWRAIAEFTRDDSALPQAAFEHEGHAVVALGAALRPGDLLIVGNSLPVRLVDTFLPARPERIVCLSQRGCNGIDGLIAGACGAALAHPGHSFLLLGDVAFLHDVGSLKCVAELAPRLTIVVSNNQGGRLFEQLPIARSDTALEPWLTPHQFGLIELARAFGLASERVATRDALARALASRASEPNVIEVLAAPSGTSQVYQALTQRVRALLAEGN